jgi:hypothetical protein
MAKAPKRLPEGLEALQVIEGATVWQLGDGSALQAARGKLYTCKCSSWHWSCQEIDGNWYCRQICDAWSCTEVPSMPKKQEVAGRASEE